MEVGTGAIIAAFLLGEALLRGPCLDQHVIHSEVLVGHEALRHLRVQQTVAVF